MAFLRPLIWTLLFFGVLFLISGPTSNWNKNGGEVAIGTSSVSGVNETSGSQELIPELDRPKTLPGSTSSDKGIITPKNNSISVEDSSLSIAGIVSFTNKERTNKQLPALKNNAALNRSAEKKLEDMFLNQYFQHQSPTGVYVSDLIRDVDYQYIVVGENLALGNFGGDQQVVTAWMNSPGHKANIMDPRFQEIGVAVGKGSYKGKEQWIAVQHFAKPLSSCPGPNSILKDKINAHTADLAGREKILSDLRKEIDSSTTNDDAYMANVQRYNSLVGEYNTYLESLKEEIARYNEQVRSFNTCAGLTAKKTNTASAIQSLSE